MGVVARWADALLDENRIEIIHGIGLLEGVLDVVGERSVLPAEEVGALLGARVDDDEAGGLIVTSALLRDAGTVSRLLCGAVRVVDSDLGQWWVDTRGLMERWGAARSSIQNWTSLGLVPLLSLPTGGGRARLVFRKDSVLAFERYRSERIAAAGERSRVSAEEGARLYERALSIRDVHRSADAIWQALSDETDYSVSAVRAAVLKHSGEVGSGGFRTKRHLDDRDRRLVSRAMGWGVVPRVIGSRYGVTGMSVRRIDLEERASVLRSLIERDASFAGWRSAGEDDGLSLAQLDGVGSAFVEPRLGGDVRALVAEARESDRPGAAEEDVRGVAYASSLLHAARMIDGVTKTRPDADMVDLAETHLRRAARHRAALVWMLRRTVVETVLQALPGDGAEVSVPELARVMAHGFAVSSASVGRLRSVLSVRDQHARLSGGVSLDVHRAVVRLGMKGGEANRAAPRFVGLPRWDDGVDWAIRRLATHPGLQSVLGRLDPLDALLIARRHGFAWEGVDGGVAAGAMTRRWVAELCGVTTARVINAERRARLAVRSE